MKKIFALVALLTMGMVAAHAECQDGPYGLKINGSKVVDAPKFGDPDAQGRVQYKASCVELAAGDEIQLINQSCGDTWMVDLDPYGSYQNFEGGKAANKLTCKVAGSYDFYIKLSIDQGDILYIGPGEDCGGGGNPGGGGGNPGGDGDAYWYWKGDVDGVPVQNELDGGLFDGGISEITVNNEAYIFVMYQKKGVAGVQYMTDGWKGKEVTHVTMVTSGNDKLYIPAGTYTLYLYDNGDGSVELSREQLAGKKLMDTGGQGIENTQVTEKAHKVFIDGQLRIVRGDKVFDATGRQL
jgi:hypothetical protein